MVNTRTKSTSKLSIKKDLGEEATRPKSRLKNEAAAKSPKLYIKQEKVEPKDSDEEYVPPTIKKEALEPTKAESKSLIKSEFTVISQFRILSHQRRGRCQEGAEGSQGKED